MRRNLWMCAVCLPMLLGPSAALSADQHSVEAIVAAMQSPISPEAAADARKFDDQIMSAGNIEGVRVYLVTDDRSTRVNEMVAGLLRAEGQNPAEWLVRVLDTDPKLINAFVAGGKYVYVYTGLLAQNPSDDELAFVLAHELGHSILKHKERQANDSSTGWAALAGLAAAFSEKNRDVLNGVATAITSSYSRVDEQEADAIGCCIARRAGYDPLRGADLFTRFQRQADADRQQREQLLAQSKAAYDQALATCLHNKQLFNSSASYQTQENANKVNAMCQDAESKRLQYNQVVEAYNAAVQEERRNVLFGDHPQDQSRIAAIAALNDYLAGRRDLASLSSSQQTQRVMTALDLQKSELLKPAQVTASSTSRDTSSAAPVAPKLSLEEQLKQLQRARDAGLITQQEYDRKRQEILARY